MACGVAEFCSGRHWGIRSDEDMVKGPRAITQIDKWTKVNDFCECKERGTACIRVCGFVPRAVRCQHLKAVITGSLPATSSCTSFQQAALRVHLVARYEILRGRAWISAILLKRWGAPHRAGQG